MGELVYMFAAQAERFHESTTCLKGMRLLADTLHPHGVRITWIVGPESAQLAAAALTTWHDTYGDDVAVHTRKLEGTVDEQCRVLAARRDAIQKALPWAKLTVAAGEQKSPDIAVVLERTGFEGLWGLCWEQIEVDNITDRGCPWGFYYMDREQRLRPAEGRSVIGMEWTARDLLKSFHSGNPCLYSTDPNDAARGGICSWDRIDYWKTLADNYRRNTRYNKHVFLLQHQEAHEMECSKHFRCYTDEDTREAAVMLDAFVAHVKKDARMMTLPEAAQLYRDEYSTTPSQYMLWEDAPVPPYNPDYAWGTPVGPWPRTFLHYDRGAQMMFIEGKPEPVCIRNYDRPWKSGEYFAEPDIPRCRLIHNDRLAWSRVIEFSITAPHAMPYGIALWGDYSLYQIGEAPGLLEGKIMSPDLLFLRYNLAPGENHLTIQLRGK